MTPAFQFAIMLLAANVLLLLPVTRPLGALLLSLVLPGWGWASLITPAAPVAHKQTTPFVFGKLAGNPAHLVLTIGFSFSATILGGLLIHYLPGPIQVWQVLGWFNLIALLPLLALNPHQQPPYPPKNRVGRWTLVALLGLLLMGLLLRFSGLNYSEFQGDEALVMIATAETIEGHADSLFLRSKGPAEVLLPLPIWFLNGIITEGLARLPFALAGLVTLLAFYLLAGAWFNPTIALYGVGFLGFSGFMVGFSRIVQYQTIVLLMSVLSVWTFWQWRESGRKGWLFASGLFAGVGFLAHYDAIFVLPVLGWMWLKSNPGLPQVTRRRSLWWFAPFLGTVLLFYIPFLRSPQADGTQSYLGDRVGAGLLKNNLLDFLHFNSFYSSFYFTLLGAIALLLFSGWAIERARWGGWKLGLGAATTFGLVLIAPNLLGMWSGVIIGLLLLAVFLSNELGHSARLMWVWFAIPFFGYNFLVATPLTHIYTILPGWALIFGWVLGYLAFPTKIRAGLNIGLILLAGIYLWHAFIRTDVPFLPNYPQSNPPAYWTPFQSPPQTGYFGFVHKTGWKGVGALYVNGLLQGDYSSNEEEDVTSWYTRHAPRACDPGAEFYFVADQIIEGAPPLTTTPNEYASIGAFTVPESGNRLTIAQLKPTTLTMPSSSLTSLSTAFDASATPAQFARNAGWSVPFAANFGGQVELLGYQLNTARAYPGGRVLLTLYWQAITPLAVDYKVFVHLDSEQKYAQADSGPVCSRYPTSVWQPGQIIADQHALHLSPQTPTGSHPLTIGLYHPESNTRLDVLDVAGNPAGVSLTLRDVTVQAQP